MLRAAFTAIFLVSAAEAPVSGEKATALLDSHTELQQRDQQLLDVGWRLVTANAAYCADAQPAIGLLLQDMASYGRSAAALRGALGLPGDIAVEAVAKGSPAAQAGLVPNDPIDTIAGQDVRALPAPGRDSWRRLASLHDAIDSALARNGALSLTWGDSEGGKTSAEIAGVAACPSRFEVLDHGGQALSEGSRVIFGRDFPGFVYDEPQFAAAVAHELAHNLLHHRAWLAAHGRTQRNIRLTEREADRLMPWLLANAGYDPAAAARFMQRWGPAHDGGIFRERTHDGWDERVEMIEAEIEGMQGLIDANGRADWATHFRRESLP